MDVDDNQRACNTTAHRARIDANIGTCFAYLAKVAEAVAERLLTAVQRQAALTDTVIVSFSGGKESVVVLDLCARHFKTVHAFFMFQVQGLSFQEAVLKWAEKKYGIEIYRMPHWELSNFYRAGVYCKQDTSIPKVVIKDVYAHVRGVFGTHWIAAGERAADSVVRRARMMQHGSVNMQRGRFYPVAYWKKADILRYIELHQLKVSPESRILGHSFRGFHEDDMALIKQHYPGDYNLIEQAFPQIGTALAHRDMYGKDKASALPN